MGIRFLVWSWNETLPAEQVAEAINQFDGGPVYAIAVDTGTGDYVLALATEPINGQEAYAAWAAS